MTEALNESARVLVQRLAEKGMTLSTAESCTGGLVAKLITDVPGSSTVFVGGVVSYTNPIKIGFLGVDPAIIKRDTEVSAACAIAMAEGARQRMDTHLAVSATGYAGPGGGTEHDPIGTVYLGISTPSRSFAERFSAPEGLDRAGVRYAAALRAMELLLAEVEGT
ncbi:MAG: CinA family protein [Clostridia bacterium]|nr:CinA family protein [Clostridia bacterium]